MTLDEAKTILGDRLRKDGSIVDSVNYVSWGPGDLRATLDAGFTADELEAIATVMRASVERGPAHD